MTAPPRCAFLIPFGRLAFGQPFEIAVLGKTRCPLYRRRREIGGGGIVEALDQGLDPGQHLPDQPVDLLAADRAPFARRIAAGQAPVFKPAGLAAKAAKTAVAQDRAFEGKLRRQARFDLPPAGKSAGLVIDHEKAAGGEAIDAVGLGGDRKRPAMRGKYEAARALGEAFADCGAMPAFLGHEPAGDLFEPRPPEGPDAGARQERGKALAPDRQQRLFRPLRQGFWKAGDEDFEGLVDDAAELGPAGIGIERIERLQLQDMTGVDRIGVAHPGFDFGHRQAARARGQRQGGSSIRASALTISGSGPSAPSSPTARNTASSRNSQRDGTVGTPSCRVERVSATSAAPIACAKSWAAMPIARSGTAIPKARRICRDIHGSCSAVAGQLPSLSPPSTSRSACCNRASISPQIASRGCWPKGGRTTVSAASASNRAG